MKNNSSPIASLPWQKERQQLANPSPHACLPWQKGRSRGVTSTIAERKRFSLDLLILLGQAKRITYFPLTCLPSQKVRQKPTNPSPLEGRSRGVTNL